VSSELLVLSNLFFDLSDLDLQAGFLQGLGFLIRIYLLFLNQFIQGLSGIFSDNAVDLGCGILERYFLSAGNVQTVENNLGIGTHQFLQGIAQAPTASEVRRRVTIL
jgi:hypothetical protein